MPDRGHARPVVSGLRVVNHNTFVSFAALALFMPDTKTSASSPIGLANAGWASRDGTARIGFNPQARNRFQSLRLNRSIACAAVSSQSDAKSSHDFITRLRALDAPK